MRNRLVAARRRGGTAFAVLAVSLVGLPAPASAATAPVYASPSGSGTACTQTSPCSITQAKSTAAARAATMDANLNVYLTDGTYRLTNPLTFTAGDSGRNGFEVVWQPAPGAHPVLSGGTPVTGWTQGTGANAALWSAPVPAGLRTRQLYADGQRLLRSRAKIASTLTRNADGYALSAPLPTYRNPGSIEMVYDGGDGPWTQPRCGVQDISATQITMRQPCFANMRPITSPLDIANRMPNGGFKGTTSPPTYMENVFELLAPGQWYLDEAADRISYYPEEGQDPNAMSFVAPRLEQLVVSDTTAAAPLHDVTFRGIEFAHTTWLQPSGDAGFMEMQANLSLTTDTKQGLCDIVAGGTCPFAAWTMPLNAVDLSGTQDVSFVRNRFVHLGGAGLGLHHGAVDDLVRGNEFTDISSNGIQLGTSDNPYPDTYSTNIAVGSSATQSSTGYSAPASRAVDGNTDSTFSHGSMSHTNEEAGAWWKTDLGTSQLINTVKVHTRTDCCSERLSDYYVFVSDSPFDMSLTPAQQMAEDTVWSSRQIVEAGSPTVVPFGVTGRYVMVQLAGTGYLSLAEVEVMAGQDEIADGNTIDNNLVHNIGAEFTGAVGINVMYARDTTIAHNQLNDLPYSGMNVGWGGWHTYYSQPDNNPNINADNVISDNLIFDVMRIRHDGGAIYANGSQGRSYNHGLVEEGNVAFEDGYANNMYYTDIGSRYVTHIGNVQYRSRSSFTGGCNPSGPFHRQDNFRTGTLNGYGCVLAPPSSANTESGNVQIPQNPGPGLVPNHILADAGLEDAYADLVTSQAPRVRLVSPVTSGQVLISGSGFTTGSTVVADGVAATSVTYLSPNYLIATLASGGTADVVTVTTASGSSRNLARAGTASQSSTYTGGDAAKAIDGDTDPNFGNGHVSHTNEDAQAWWQVDLGAAHDISLIRLHNRSGTSYGRLSNYWVFVSDSPFDTTLSPAQQANEPGVWARYEPSPGGLPTILPLPDGVTGRYVMVQLAGTNYLNLAEVEVQ